MLKRTVSNILSIEIWHEIFTYLSAVDIFNAFTNINSYFNSILSNYNQYNINFQSCLKTHFDLICGHIQPNQILSLTLSNSNDTPGQFELFIAKFNIKSLTCLHSLTLIEIDPTCLIPLIISLNEIQNQITSFSIINCFDSYNLNSTELAIMQLFFRQLEKLVISNARYMTRNNDQLGNLRHLSIQQCNMNDLEHIFHLTPSLYSLELTICRESGFWIPVDDIPLKLKRIVLNTHIQMSMIDIKEFLSKTSQLKYFELQTNIRDLIFNGDEWISLVENLITFDFKFRISKAIIHPNAFINSFRTTFWIEEKRWFIAYDEEQSLVYTVPRFVEKCAEYHIYSSFEPPSHTTIDINTPFFYDNINELTINQCLCRSLPFYRFTNITRLSFSGEIPFDQLHSIVDLSNVYYLKLPEIISIKDLKRIFPNVFPRVQHLYLRSLPIGHSWRHSIIMKQIRILHIQTINCASQLCQQFPNIERLYVDCVKSYRQIRWIIHRLKPQLSYMSLSWLNNQPKQLSFRLFHKWLKKQQQYQTYRSHIGSFSCIYLWINNELNEEYTKYI
ncbi:unnamed protein product [Adineta steineri]|uniref:F-box domain-containing protein n=1 Tax=Adineta steineri TaxID=433720 RepID=A0A814QTY4_9BILA|nr:unnamed protein product [Adineta steineri]CAF1124338.1 unnamed protein product [Adineta steineri]